ncbi:MAG TPA: ATP synthase subunit I [Burkholderiaceae bacterium]|nr:ATP synthase subunit I [Burkholderiaceae bacterium]
MNAGLRRLGKPVRTAVIWQALATAALALLGALLAGFNGTISAVLGGMVSMLSGVAATLIATRRTEDSAGGVLFMALRAEGVRVVLIVILLWLVLSTYREVVAPAFFGAFVVTLLLFSAAFFIREDSSQRPDSDQPWPPKQN